MKGLGTGVFEIASPYRGNAFRVVYGVQIGADSWGVPAFQKQSTQGIKNPKHRIDLTQGSIETVEGDAGMKDAPLEVFRGSGNIYRDLSKDNADVKQFKALLAAEIIKTLDREHLSVRQAQARTGVAAADFSRIRNADLGRFTLDRLVGMITGSARGSR
jgi:predicted XRE-type DNA-binding protein